MINPYEPGKTDPRHDNVDGIENRSFTNLAALIAISWALPLIGFYGGLGLGWYGAEAGYSALVAAGYVFLGSLTLVIPGYIAAMVARKYGVRTAAFSGIWIGLFLFLSFLIEL